MSAFECAPRALFPSAFSGPTLLDLIGSKVTASPGFTVLAHRPTESLVVLKDGASKRFCSKDFAPPEGDDGGMDQSDQIPSRPEDFAPTKLFLF
ncbi:hypothetical protein GBA52_025084 [Prunus armeniaca]|nr:hypothetical protein GBA52_025084 [Prunus armeniaca]